MTNPGRWQAVRSIAPPLLLGSCLLAGAPSCSAGQQELDITIPTTLGDTTETFWLQIPRGYQPETPCPLLVGWHQWGGNRFEMRAATSFDSVANARGWIAVSHEGVSPTHWNNQATQSHVVDVIRWIEAHYSVDPARIYMVGASMGGAAGMVFANNHLDPAGPMIAAAASLSGIQDCERRFHEQGINYSMIASFGGTPEEVPFTYHRNSAVCFADSTASMHSNSRHLPLYLTFGLGTSDQVWREHAEDLYAVMAPFADTVIIRESAQAGHGWGCAEEGRICDFLGSFVLDRAPRRISIQADEEGRWCWAELWMREALDSFARLEALARPELRRLDVTMLRNVARAELDLPSLEFPLDAGVFSCAWSILDGAPAQLSILGLASPPAFVLRDGVEFADWLFDPTRFCLILNGDGSGLYVVVAEPSGVRIALDAGESAAERRPALALRSCRDGSILALLEEPGFLEWRLYDASGRRVFSVAPRRHGPGEVRLRPPKAGACGVYFAQGTLQSERGTSQASGRLVILR